uniref:Microtubule associated protein 6 n=1 Tax=Varanus komodoensis TaxID=61221 RepID=A0A8D2KT66_VARKO
MAWPCISRACCIARFWNQLDKADIAVPLVFTKYSEATDIPGTQVVLQQQPHPPSAIESQPAALGGDLDGASRAPVSADSVMRQDYKPWKVQRPEPSYKPRSEYQPSETPFQKESQYQKDFRPWPIPKRGDHPWIPKQMPIPALEADKGPKERSGSQERRRKAQVGPEEEPGREEVAAGSKGRAAVDALNWQIKEEVTARVSTSSYRNEFRPWTDIKPVKAIRAKSQYKPPEEKMTHKTSYNTQFTAESAKPGPSDNKFLEHRRVRSLYSEPYKEPPKVEKPSPQPSKPKKTTTSHKPLKKAKDKQTASSRSSKKKGAEGSSAANAEEKEKSKEMNNKLAEAKE